MAGGHKKASFTNLDAGASFQVQFNPKEFKLDETAAWKDSDEFQQEKPLLTFDRGKPSVVTMELIFDTTDTGECVELMFVREVRSLLSVTVEETKDGKTIKRPPHVKFEWKDFTFDCIVEKVSVTYLMFKADGTPLRAKVNVTLKQRKLETIQTLWTNVDPLSAMESMLEGSGTAKGNGDDEQDGTELSAKQGEVGEGETANQIAHKYGQEDWRPIAAANNWNNPMEPPPGPAVIPSDAVAASIFTHLNNSESPANWGDFEGELHPDSNNADAWDIGEGEFEHNIVEEEEVVFSSYEGENVEATTMEFSYGEDNVAEFSETYGGDVEATTMEFGESEGIEMGEAAEYGGHTYGEENVAEFSDAYGGDVEATTMEFGESENGDLLGSEKSEFGGFTYGEENEANFSETYSGDVEASTMEFGESEGIEMGDAAEYGGHSYGEENVAEFSDTKAGDVAASTTEIGASDKAAGDWSGGGGGASGGGRQANPGDSSMTTAERNLDQGVASVESAGNSLNETSDKILDKVDTIKAKMQKQVDHLTNEDTKATDPDKYLG